ncbi:DUF4286 family protein [Bradyrhizobium liaoningense]|uniref:DUF4286 family protein n=1 Tax=Bradyrhizobium liaoningense TaxID=43992 RepID=UPI001BA936A1|nr:DUF4286 family protein [Bradyrhizobium liaoningense]MBR0713889.1 hypothetical protein [Bradyrhizobium liaoningense]
MSLSGSGVIAIWNDITDEGRANFYEWHDREHIPERVGIPGFLRGRRYIALSGTPEYFTLYEVQDKSVLTGADYLARLNSPTEWTTRSVQHFRNTSRSLCDVEVSLGVGSGGFIGTIRFDCEPGQDPEILKTISGAILAEVSNAPAISAAHICRADESASNVKTAEQRGRAANMIPRWVLMVEGTTQEAVEHVLSTHLSHAVLGDLGAPEALHGVYRLQFDLVGTRLGQPAASRAA